MEAPVADSLQLVESLRSPVPRSCHIGNNTANVWGWLAHARNSRLVQYDHTLYGVDENCIPWVVLGDGGRVQASYSPSGEAQRRDVGLHVNDLMAQVERRYTSHLNYGVRARYRSQDLMLYHLGIANELSTARNASTVTWDSRELLAHRELVSALLCFFGRTDGLSLLFDRWVRTSRGGSITMRRLRSIETAAAAVKAVDIDGTTVFSGTLDQLRDQMMSAFEALLGRLTVGSALPPLSYPWLTLPFAYLATSVFEYAVDPTQRIFWHAAGSASQYYLNRPDIQNAFERLRDDLVSGGFLPHGAQLRMIPTFPCQLVATSSRSLPLLESLIETWQDLARRHSSSFASSIESLATTTDAFAVAAEHCLTMCPGDVQRLRNAMDHFNSADINQLPVAHVVGRRHPNYNKYGVAQQTLRGARILTSEAFRALTWGEAELLVKTLAHMTLDRRG